MQHITICKVWATIQYHISHMVNMKSSSKGFVEAATTTLQNFALALFRSLLTNLSQHLVLLRQVHKLQYFLAQRQPFDQILMHSHHRLITWTWSSCRVRSSCKKLCNSGGQPTFPLEIVQFYLAAFWVLELRNPSSQDSPRKLHNTSQ